MDILDYHLELSHHCPVSINTTIKLAQGDVSNKLQDSGHTVDFTKLYWTEEGEKAVKSSLLHHYPVTPLPSAPTFSQSC